MLWDIVIIILILILFYFLAKIKSTESFKNLRNIFFTNIFDNKTIFLIANNPNLSKKTQDFLNNHDYSNSLIVRFNGYKPQKIIVKVRPI